MSAPVTIPIQLDGGLVWRLSEKAEREGRKVADILADYAVEYASGAVKRRATVARLEQARQESRRAQVIRELRRIEDYDAVTDGLRVALRMNDTRMLRAMLGAEKRARRA